MVAENGTIQGIGCEVQDKASRFIGDPGEVRSRFDRDGARSKFVISWTVSSGDVTRLRGEDGFYQLGGFTS